MKIIVTTLPGNVKVPVQVDHGDTIDSLKTKVREQDPDQGATARNDEMRVLLGGRTLEDHKTIDDYGIKEMQQLQLLYVQGVTPPEPTLEIQSPEPQVEPSEVAQHFSSLPPPDVMEFESWWTEQGQRRYMILLYHSKAEVFEVMVDDSTVPLRVQVYDRYKQPFKAWDLYVGCQIQILGKPTTLMKAKHATMQWIDDEARRLWKKKESLERQLGKYRTLPDLIKYVGVTVRRLEESKSGALGGTVNLGKLAKCVAYLQKELAVFRPEKR